MKLTYNQQLVAYYKRLIANGTLSQQTDLSTLLPQNPDVVEAGLKTADREAIGAVVRDSLAQVALMYRTSTERLATGLKGASTGYARSIERVEAKKKGGILPFNAKRRKQLRAVSNELQIEKKAIDDELDLLKVLNKP